VRGLREHAARRRPAADARRKRCGRLRKRTIHWRVRNRTGGAWHWCAGAKGHLHGEGVRGEGEHRGVVGVARLRPGEPFHVGVFGAATEGDPELPNKLEATGGDAGVVGFSASGGTGVLGWSTRAGAAVEGRCDGVGNGGSFASARAAQVHLEPSLTRTPTDGDAGDLLVIDDPSTPARRRQAQLWFCKRSSAPGVSADWVRIA